VLTEPTEDVDDLLIGLTSSLLREMRGTGNRSKLREIAALAEAFGKAARDLEAANADAFGRYDAHSVLRLDGIAIPLLEDWQSTRLLNAVVGLIDYSFRHLGTKLGSAQYEIHSAIRAADYRRSPEFMTRIAEGFVARARAEKAAKKAAKEDRKKETKP